MAEVSVEKDDGAKGRGGEDAEVVTVPRSVLLALASEVVRRRDTTDAALVRALAAEQRIAAAEALVRQSRLMEWRRGYNAGRRAEARKGKG